MVQLKPKSMEYKVHSLIANKDLGKTKTDIKEGDMRQCLIIAMTDGRFAVFSYVWNEYFYYVIKDEDELHETFNEQLAI